MKNPKKNPLNDDCLAAESKQGADDAAVLPSRLDRYSKAHHRAVEMAHYARSEGECKLAAKLFKCGSYLLFRDYYTVGKVRLHAAQFCKAHMLCPLCAIRRGAKMVKAYMDRLQVITASQPDLKPYMVTLTVKDGPDLLERFEHLYKAVQKLHKARVTPRMYSEACKADGAVWSYEFKRGKNSGQWHPHMHAVWLCKTAPDAKALSEQWKQITGDSFIVDVRPFHDEQDTLSGFLEVFKYAVKFSDMPLEDNFEGYRKLHGKRLIASFGAFRSVDVPAELTDEKLDDLPFIDLLFKFVHGAGYSLAASSPEARIESAKRPKGRPHEVAQPYESLHLRQLRAKHAKRAL
jgi:hypothetical protein